jgi:Derlin-2/3
MLIIRTITAAIVLLSWPGWLGLYDLGWTIFESGKVFTISQLPQIWRLATGLCITGPKWGLIMDPFIFWQYSSQLETSNARLSSPGAYAFYLLFNAVIVLVSHRPRRLLKQVLLPSLSLVISARPVHLSCHGSWKRGRLPLALWQRSSFANPKERCWSVSMVGFVIEKTF